MIAALFALGFLALTWLVVSGHTAATDLAIAQWFAAHRPGALVPAADIVGAATAPAVVAVGGLAALLVVWRRRRSEWLLVASSVFGAFAVGWLVKGLVDRPRPPSGINLYPEAEPSYPSGHVLILAVLLGCIVALTGRHLRVACAILAVVCLQRLVVGAHWMTDDLAALLLAGAIVFAVMALRNPDRPDQTARADAEADGAPAHGPGTRVAHEDTAC